MTGGVSSRLRRIALLGVVLHALVVGAAPFEHHDLVCHLKTPQHCSSCTNSPVGSSSQSAPSLGASHLPDVGGAVADHVAPESAILTTRTTGRSPPAAS